MALVEGTNCGFCLASPTIDPAGTNSTMDDWADVSKYTSPATAVKITEMGWYCDTTTEASNFEVGLYAADGASVPGEAGTLLYVSRTNAKGTTAGWKKVTGLDWDISPNTVYWLGVQLDNTATTTNINYYPTGFHGLDYRGAQATLPDPFGGGAIGTASGSDAIYAVYTAAATGTNSQINIGDAWKPISAIQVNIGDAWKPVAGMQVNIGDAWKPVF